MSLLRAPAAATARRGALDGPPEPKSPPLIVGAETAAAAAAAAIEHGQRRVEALQHHLGRVFLDAALVGPFAGLQLRPRCKPWRPSSDTARRPCRAPSLKITTRCHSVFSLRSPVALSRQFSEVATLRLAIGRPSWVRRISGSLPRFPTRITLFTLPAIAALHSRNHYPDDTVDRDPIRSPPTCELQTGLIVPVIHI